MEFYTDIFSLLTTCGYFFLFLTAVLEGPVVTIIAGFLVTQGLIPIVYAYGLVAAGDMFGDLLYYSYGRWGESRIMSWFAFKGARQSPAAEYLREEPTKALIFAKLTHDAGLAFLVTAGIIRVRIGTFLISIALATLIKSLLLLSFGYAVGTFYNAIHAQLGKITLIFFTGIIIGVTWYVRMQLRSPGTFKSSE
jgi:membrane protein DedA with SNARE-associated domain